MAYIICNMKEALLAKERTPPIEQPDENLAIVNPGQRISVMDRSVRRLSDNLAMFKLAGRFTWTSDALPFADSSILYFNPNKFHISDAAWELQSTETTVVLPRTPPVVGTDVSSAGQKFPGSIRKIKNEDIVVIARRFGLKPEAVQAVLDVESNGSGFLDSGRPKILFEAAWFGKLTNDIYNSTHPDISCFTWAEARKYYKGGEAEWQRLEKSKELNNDAALKSASWGLGQIMGFNYEACGYSDVSAFVKDMEVSEAKQLEIMFKFIQSKQLIDELRREDWEGFASLYNGEGYKVNQYDSKLNEKYQYHRQIGTFANLKSATNDRNPPKESVRQPYNPNSPINWNDPKCRISKYFTVGEVTQNDPRRKPLPGSDIERNCLELARELDHVRETWGSPIGVTSWYRPPDVNAEVGGVFDSQHLSGRAADIYTIDSDGFGQRDRNFEHWLDTVAWKGRALGYGISSRRGFTHVDLRIGEERWNY